MSPRRRESNLHLPACMYAKHGAYWLVKRGKWIRLGKDLRAALIAYAKRTAPSSGQMGKLIDEAMLDIESGVKTSTAKQYRIAAAKLKEYLVEFEPRQVQQSDVAGIKRALKRTPNMANRVISVLRLIFAYAVENQIVENNPCVGITRHEEHKRDRLITWDEFDAIKARGPLRLEVFADLLFGTGQRPIDVLKLRRSDLLAEGIRFQQQKTGAKLIVPWTPEMREATKRLTAGKVAAIDGYLFTTRAGKPMAYKTMYDMWVRACRAAKIPDTDLRDVRAFSASEAKKQGLDPTALLGHKSRQMTERYLRDKETPVVQGPRIRHLIDRQAK